MDILCHAEGGMGNGKQLDEKWSRAKQEGHVFAGARPDWK